MGKRTDGYREFRNLTVFLERCNEWKPPLASVYKRTLCVAHSFGPHAFFESLTLLQDTDVLVRHGNGCWRGPMQDGQDAAAV